jgi:hypothetical protein
VSPSVRQWADSRALTNQSQSAERRRRNEPNSTGEGVSTERSQSGGTSATKRTQFGRPGWFDRAKPIRDCSHGDPTDQTKPPIRLVRLRSIPGGSRADPGTSGSRTLTDRSQFETTARAWIRFPWPDAWRRQRGTGTGRVRPEPVPLCRQNETALIRFPLRTGRLSVTLENDRFLANGLEVDRSPRAQRPTARGRSKHRCAS